ncbi:hypothetical protein Cgig2_023303 [Carnegiea gigantea]|uniref:Uncharacterized protein n=1 Tax=Carnegiea gigantea TaxID=171969 RepID=A0A9Q1GUA6_9CARY|nr:hypothetical protein Cgig2_023303 [Carnegiea gigantea]
MTNETSKKIVLLTGNEFLSDLLRTAVDCLYSLDDFIDAGGMVQEAGRSQRQLLLLRATLASTLRMLHTCSSTSVNALPSWISKDSIHWAAEETMDPAILALSQLSNSVEARHKKRHGHGQHASPPAPEPSSPPAPTMPPVRPPQSVAPSLPTLPPPPTEAPELSPDVLPPPPKDGIGVPVGYLSPSPGYQAPPYQIHVCGYPCSDSNDCDWACALCCYRPSGNSTCCYDVPMFP